MNEPILVSKGNYVVSNNPSGKPFHQGGVAFKIGPTQSKWHSLSFCIGRQSGCLATNNPAREKDQHDMQVAMVRQNHFTRLTIHETIRSTLQKREIWHQEFALSIKN